MTLREFITKCEAMASKYGDDCEVNGWGDEAAAIGISISKAVGTVKTSDWKEAGTIGGRWSETTNANWKKLIDKFGADCSMDNEKTGTTTFFKAVSGKDASISL